MSQVVWKKDGKHLIVECIHVVASKSDKDGNPIQQGGKVAQLETGGFCHGDGEFLPFRNEAEIRGIFTRIGKTGEEEIMPEHQELLDEILEWFTTRHDREETERPRIYMDHRGFPFFEDGTPVDDDAILYEAFEPGAMLTAAIVGMSKRLELEAGEAVTAGVRRVEQKPTPEPQVEAPKKAPVARKKTAKKNRVAAGRRVATKPAASTSPVVPEAEAAATGG